MQFLVVAGDESCFGVFRRSFDGFPRRGEFIPLFPNQIEAVFAFFQRGQCRLNRKLKILVVCLRRHLLTQGFSVERIVAARAHPPQG